MTNARNASVTFAAASRSYSPVSARCLPSPWSCRRCSISTSGGLGITATSEVKPNYGVRVPCSTKDANGKNQTYSNYANVKVRVLNGTKFVGFAKAVSTALSNRQFKVTGWDNYKGKKVERTTIYFGKNAINEAYTLNTNFTDAVMVMDDRDDKLIDVVLGARSTICQQGQPAERRHRHRKLRGMRARPVNGHLAQGPRS